MEKIKEIIKRPDEKKGHVTFVSNTLENLQRNVGGNIEVFRFASDCAVICNEDGKMLGLESNCVCVGELFVGDILIVGIDGSEFCDVPESVLEMRRKGVLFQPVEGW